jgi:ribosomal protein uL24
VEPRVVCLTSLDSSNERTAKVTAVYRRRWVIHVEKITRENSRGNTVNIGVDPSKVVITKLKLDKVMAVGFCGCLCPLMCLHNRIA